MSQKTSPSLSRNEIAVLLVEDEEPVALDLARAIGEMGFAVMGVARSADEALRLCAQKRPDLVLMDAHLADGQDGVATAARLRERFDLPVVFLTAFADDETLARARGIEPLGYLVKPVRDHDLKAALQLALYRHGADSKLRERERWFATTLRSVGDGVLAVDPDMKVTFVNPEAERLTGVPLASAVGRWVPEVLCLLDERTHKPLQNPFARALREGRTITQPGLVVVSRGDGRECPIENSAAPIIDHGGQVLGAVIVFKDVSRKRHLEEQFIVADRLVALGTLAGGVAHEINNPLTLITNNAHFVSLELQDLQKAVLSSTLAPDEGGRRLAELQAAVQDLIEGARRAAGIIEDMRRFSAHEPASRERVDVRATLEWAIRMSAVHIMPRAKLETDLADLPLIAGNRTRLAQVFMNVLINAGQAIPEGEPREHRVRVVGRRRDERVVVEISDTGCGMSREVRQRVFEPFFTTKRVGEGSGLGMAVAHGIITALGGRIEIDSVEQRGTTVRVILPTEPVALA